MLSEKPGLPNTPEGTDHLRLRILEGKTERLTIDIAALDHHIAVLAATAGLHRALFHTENESSLERFHTFMATQDDTTEQ